MTSDLIDRFIYADGDDKTIDFVLKTMLSGEPEQSSGLPRIPVKVFEFNVFLVELHFLSQSVILEDMLDNEPDARATFSFSQFDDRLRAVLALRSQ